MRKFGISFAALLAGYPSIALAQVDPDWSRREMERMQAQQERWEAQSARQRAEQERGAARQSGGGTSTVAVAKPMGGEKMDRLSRSITSEGLGVVFTVAAHVCPVSTGPVALNSHAEDDATSLMSNDERDLLMYYCGMYILGKSAGKDATVKTRSPPAIRPQKSSLKPDWSSTTKIHF